MRTTHRFAVVAALLLSVPLAACGSSSSEGAGGSSGEGAEVATTVAPEDGTDATVPADEGEGTEEPSEGANPGVETLVDGPADAANTVTFTAEGTWDPSSLEVASGEVITFVAAEGAPTAAVTFDGSNTYTITTGLTESFTLDEPGSYTVSEYLSGAEMTVTVTG